MEFVYPMGLIQDIEASKSILKKAFSAIYIILRLGARLFILFFILIGALFTFLAFTNANSLFVLIFAVFFYILAAISWKFIESGGSFDSIKKVLVSASGIEMMGDFGLKWGLKAEDIDQIVLVDGGGRPEEKIAARHGAVPFFATYIATVGRYGDRYVAYTPVLFIPASSLPQLNGIVAGWKKETASIKNYDEETTIQKDDRRRLKNFAKAFGNKKVIAGLEKELGPD